MRYKPRVSLAQISKKALCLHNSDFVPLTRIAQIWSWKSPLFILNYICLFDYLFISSQMSAKPYFIGSTGILLLW